MNQNNKTYKTYSDFLDDDLFIMWRLSSSEELSDYWETYIQENPLLKSEIDKAVEIFTTSVEIGNKSLLSASEKNTIYNQINLNVSQKEKKRKSLVYYFSSAAAILLLLISTTLYLKMNDSNILQGKSDVIVGQTLPGEQIYIVSGNKTIELNQDGQIELSETGTASFIDDSTNTKQEIRLAKDDMNKLVVPYGKRSFLTLSDGTKIWLNSGTQLDFPSTFSGKAREIKVSGEIFIDVAKSVNRPFIVHTPELKIQVYGTSFNVSAYKDDTGESVVLVNGKVQVSTKDNRIMNMIPNEKVLIANNKLVKEKVDASDYTRWVKGVMEFNQAPLSQILQKIGRYYNVKFENNPNASINQKTYTGELYLSDNLDSVMISISDLSGTRYERKNDIISITKK